MESGSKKEKQKGSGKWVDTGRDRLSELPDEVLVHILSFLPTADAVRTIQLRRFGKLWTLVPTLDFSFDKYHEMLLVKRKAEVHRHGKYLLQFVRNALNLHKAPTIEKFLLDMNEVQMPAAEVQLWIQFALDREAKTLIVQHNSVDFSPFPSSLFTSQSLVTLRLEYCEIQLSSGGVHLGSLTTLGLTHVYIKGHDNGLNKFVSGCPSLQELLIEEVPSDIKLTSPSIEKLCFMSGELLNCWTIDCPNLKILDTDAPPEYMECLNVPSVRQVTIECFVCCFDIEENYETIAPQYKTFLDGFQNAEDLTFEVEPDEPLACCWKANMDFAQNRWKRVVLKSELQERFIEGICHLVKNSPCLEELVIYVIQRGLGMTSRVGSHEVSSPYMASHLKLVSMHGYGKPYEGQLHLAEFLLKSAVNLEKLVIFSVYGKELSSSDELKFVKQLSNCPRASTKARIVFE